jgi:hypothetical protein
MTQTNWAPKKPGRFMPLAEFQPPLMPLASPCVEQSTQEMISHGAGHELRRLP